MHTHSILWTKSIQFYVQTNREPSTLPLFSFFLGTLLWRTLLQLQFFSVISFQPTNQRTIICDEPKVFSKRTERCGPFNLHVMFQFRCMRPTGYVGVCFGFCCCFPFFNGLLLLFLYACLVLSHLCSQTTHDNTKIIMGF